MCYTLHRTQLNRATFRKSTLATTKVLGKAFTPSHNPWTKELIPWSMKCLVLAVAKQTIGVRPMQSPRLGNKTAQRGYLEL